MGATILGCGDIAHPDRDAGYEFRHRATGLSFRWPTGYGPVRYWISAGGGDLATWVQAGISAWREQFLYAEYDGVIVGDSANADVIVRIVPSNPPTGPLTEGSPVLSACRGETNFNYTADFTGLDGPMTIQLEWRPGYEPQDTRNCLFRVAVHEIGHSLGIFDHSPSPDDLMAPTPRIAYPTLNDRRTVERLYHTPPDVRPATREAIAR